MYMNKLIALPIIAGIAVVAIYYASPLFINVTVDEPLPETMKDGAMKDQMMEKVAMDENATKPMIVLMGNFVGAGDGIHNAEGVSKVVAINDGQIEHRILRLENFKSTNGPDLYVYLSKDARSIGDGYVDLGRLKGNVGNQNYHIPDDVNLDEYSHVLIWCKQFSVLFGHANLA
jgi:hypothetical protein